MVMKKSFRRSVTLCGLHHPHTSSRLSKIFALLDAHRSQHRTGAEEDAQQASKSNIMMNGAMMSCFQF